MAEGFDGKALIEVLNGYLKDGSSVLELGMGPGKDLDLLSEKYRATGSDLSNVFIERYRKEHPNADLLILDAVTIDTESRFDCIYSNKVLMHLSREELKRSFERQIEVLNPGGLLFHSFWKGDSEEFIEDLRFVYHDEISIMKFIGEGFEALEITEYSEMDDGDSFYLVLRKM